MYLHHTPIEPKNNPLMIYNKSADSLVVKGNSSGKCVNSYYKQILQTIKLHLLTKDSITATFELAKIDYLSIGALFRLFKVLQQLNNCDKKVEIIWNYKSHEFNMEKGAFDLSGMERLIFNPLRQVS